MSKTCPVCGTTYPDADAFCPKDGTTLRTDESAGSLIGSVIADRYLVSKLLGEGGMGQVYLAGHVRLPQQAAIKVLHSSMVQDPAAVARFNREAANAARIEHERVARVFDFGETSNGLVYLAMEFVPGKTLREVLDTAGRLPPTRAANIVYQVAEGLDAAHRISIVHRDLKPDNILVVSDEQGGDRCKVVDFGIAKAFDDSDSRKTQLTQAGAIIGTPEFMSPEQVLGEQLDARSDVYALGVVAYHLLTGALPFSAATPERSLTARLMQDPLSLKESAPDIEWPAELQAAIDGALSREPETRTPSALAFADELVAATELWTGESVLRGRSPKSSSGLTAARTAAMAGGGADAALRSATTVGMNAPPDSVARAAAKASAPDVTARPATARGSNRTALIVGALAIIGAIAAGVMLMSGGGTDTAGTGEPTVANVDAAANESDVGGAQTRAAIDNPSGSVAPSAADERIAAAPEQPAGRGNRDGTSGSSSTGADAGITVAGGSSAATTISALDSGTPATPASARDADVEREFSAIKARLLAAAESDQESVSRAEIPKLERLLPRYGTAQDSVWVYVQLVTPYAIIGDDVKACSALRTANRLAISPEQILAVRQVKDAFPECL